MADPLRILARVANNAAKISAEDLERLADEQQLNLDEKQRLRRALDAYNEMVASGIVTYDELNDLRLLGGVSWLRLGLEQLGRRLVGPRLGCDGRRWLGAHSTARATTTSI